VSLCLATLIGYKFFIHSKSLGRSIAIGLGVGMIYPFLGAVIAEFCKFLDDIIFPDAEPQWDTTTKILIGMVWPAFLAYYVINFLFLSVMNRISR
jgi:hypothetical protein